MLDLYTHEIPSPDDRAIRRFLWQTTFHDADVLAIRYPEDKCSDVTLHIRHHICNDGRQGMYLLRFQGVKHVEYAANPGSRDRIYSTRFLDSATLHREQAACRKPLYHLRIRTWSGYLDLIFERFSIRLEGGRVDYRAGVVDDEIVAANRDRRYRQTCAEAAVRLASRRPYDMDVAQYRALGLYDEDQDEYHACRLYILSQDGSPAELTAMSRQVLDMPLVRFHARTYAAYHLGRHGNETDLPRLTALLLALPACHCLLRRVVLDAMAMISERMREGRP